MRIVSEVENVVEGNLCLGETIEVSQQDERVEAVQPAKEKVLWRPYSTFQYLKGATRELMRKISQGHVAIAQEEWL